MDNHKVLSELYITYTNEEPQNIEELPDNRKYRRLEPDEGNSSDRKSVV